MSSRKIQPSAAFALATCAAMAVQSGYAYTAESNIARGKYLTRIAGCNDCHTAGYFMGKPDMSRYLGGSDVGFEVPGVGTFVGSNLTPDGETGLGRWSKEQIIRAFTGGVRPDGRVLAPVMPWPSFAVLTKEDADAIAAYLMSIPAVRNEVPAPVPPGGTPKTFVLRATPPAHSESLKK